MVDSNDRDRVVEARDEFHSIYAERSKAQKLKNQKVTFVFFFSHEEKASGIQFLF